MEIIHIDGAQGEGGGQVLRTALTLSLITGRPFRIDRIRAGRAKPGLLRQHLTAVEAAAAVGGARTDGAVAGSQSLEFHPQGISPGDYRFAIGTAGSCTLVLQTILPALLRAAGPSRIRLSGGTHNPHAPPADFLARAFLPLLVRMGAQVTLRLLRHGFYPAGGGEIEVAIEPAAELRPLILEERGALLERRAEALVAAVPFHVAERELETVRRRLGWRADELHPVGLRNDQGPGNVLMLTLVHEGITEVFTGFGERRTSAERVAEGVCRQAADYLESGAAVGPHLADQLLLPLALAGGHFTTMEPTLHTRTNLAVIGRFLPRHWGCDALGDGRWRIEAMLG